MLRLAAGTVLAGHGLIHLMGFVVAWQIAILEGLTYRTTIINGLLEVGDAGARGLGIAWLLLALAFLVAACGVARAWLGHRG